MSRYENRPTPENNVSDTHPLSEFLWLGLAALLLVSAVTAALVFAGHHLARYVPFTWEQAIAFDWPEKPASGPDEARAQQLLAALLETDPLKPPLAVNLTVAEGTTLNAMAGPGGELLIFDGLLQRLDNDVAISFVLAHEMAHVRHRDVMEGMLSQGILLFAGALLTGNDSQMVELALLATGLSFSRQQELEADWRAMESVMRRYGHLDGVEEVFLALSQQSLMGDWLSTHPDTEDRLAQLARFRQSH
ncbi:M48 family metallopeptidase [Marinobacter hydrocarbonoclasticus]|nr:M48 family metallopeptidase [Marinobacter nauticus]